MEAESTELGHSSIYENKGSSLCNHVKDTPLINANDGPAVKSTALRRHVFAAARLHANDTPLPVLAPGNGKSPNPNYAGRRIWEGMNFRLFFTS